MRQSLTYPDSVIASLRFQFCPMCASPLTREVIFDDNIPRVRCANCDWIQLSSNVVGVAAIARNEDGIAAILPPGEDGIGFPAGLVEYGESPEDAAVREILEETGLRAEIIGCLGWIYVEAMPWPGPMVQFLFEAKITGGELRGSDEGSACIYPMDELPPVSSRRRGSQAAIKLYLAGRLEV